MTSYTRCPNSANPDKHRSSVRTITVLGLLCMTVTLPLGSAIGQSAMVALPSGRAIGQTGISQDRLVGRWTCESVIVERMDGTKIAPFGPNPKGLITLSLLMVDIPCNSSAPTYPKLPPRIG